MQLASKLVDALAEFKRKLILRLNFDWLDRMASKRYSCRLHTPLPTNGFNPAHTPAHLVALPLPVETLAPGKRRGQVV